MQKIVRKKLDKFIKSKMQMQKSEFATLIGVSNATISKWLYTKAEPNVYTLKRFAKDCGLTFEEVMQLFEVE
ncbi:MAG: helix-turn-helix domain-containing protein [Corallococcus sp.]|nr:helix-turn-helix domain-containing protein [Corallococcus sp.]